MNKLTLAIQDEANIKIVGNNIEIEFPKECNRDLWKAQITYWLENIENEYNEIFETGNIRLTNNNKLKIDKQ